MLLNRSFDNFDLDTVKMLILSSTQVMYTRRLSGRGEVRVMKSQLTPLMRRKKMREGTQQTKSTRRNATGTKDQENQPRAEQAH